MIDRLEKSNVTFTESEKAAFLSILPSVNYYRISVFSLYLGEDKSFSHLLSLYRFDRFLIESMIKLVAPIEIQIKTTLAYYLSTESVPELHGEQGSLIYLNDQIYKEKHLKNKNVKRMLSDFSDYIGSKQDKDPSIKHHVEYYGGSIPIWVLVEHLTMGNIATFITYLDRSVRKGWVRSFLEDTNDKWIIEWVKTIQFLRNTGAHYSRFYGKRFNYNPTLHPEDVKKLPEKYNNEKDSIRELDKLSHTLFGGLLIIKRFYLALPIEEQRRWEVFLTKLDERVLGYKADLYYIGFPSNWKKLLEIKE